MRNISFDNPYWLLLLVPLFIGVLVPFFIAIRKDNKSKSVIASLVIHLVIALLVGLAVAGTVITTVITETQVIVVADLSYSTGQKRTEMNELIAEMQKSLPKNGKLGVVCFGKDAVVHTPIGGEFTGIENAVVDDSATDIAAALTFAGTLFDEGVLKRVVLLTDGAETVSENVSGMVAAVEQLVTRDIAVDAVYVDSNLAADIDEVQLTGVEFTENVYLNHETHATLLLQSNKEAKVVISIWRDGEKVTDRAVTLPAGYHVEEIPLDTSLVGAFSYEVRVSAEQDSSPHNNRYLFTQKVSDDLRVLLISTKAEDIAAAVNLFGDRAKLDVVYLYTLTRDLQAVLQAYATNPNVVVNHSDRFLVTLKANNGKNTVANKVSLVKDPDDPTLPTALGPYGRYTALDGAYEFRFDYPNLTVVDKNGTDIGGEYTYTVKNDLKITVTTKDGKTAKGVSLANDMSTEVPGSVEELCFFDEIVIANTDIRDLPNVTAFVESVETVVSQYGKGLMTIGDNKLQNRTDETLESLENMLPVKFGNGAQDPKLYTIVIDVSRSMFQASRLSVAKQAAIHLLTLLDDDDDVTIVAMAGDIEVVQATVKAKKREEIARVINQLKPQQGTSIGGGLKAAIEKMVDHTHLDKQVILISDGMNFTDEVVTIDGHVMKGPKEVAAYMRGKGIKVSTMDIYTSETSGVNLLKEVAKAGAGNYYRVENEKSLGEFIFSDVADDLTESIINGESLVHIARDKDSVLGGITHLNAVMGYVQSRAKASAKTVLTVDYVGIDGEVKEVPLYAYWNYGNGRVACFTSDISGDWAAKWQGGNEQKFLCNALDSNIPDEKIERPFTVNISYEGLHSGLEIIPAAPDAFATVDITVTRPDGVVTTETLSFYSSRYFYRFDTPLTGEYHLHIVYTTKVGTYADDCYFNVSYLLEYDSFANYDSSRLHAAIRHRGTVSEGKIPDLSPDPTRVATYRLTFAVPFMIAAVALFVLDIIVRKIKPSDIKSLFKRSTYQKN